MRSRLARHALAAMMSVHLVDSGRRATGSARTDEMFLRCRIPRIA